MIITSSPDRKCSLEAVSSADARRNRDILRKFGEADCELPVSCAVEQEGALF